MIRATAVVRDMAAERRSLDFRGPGPLARMPPVAENIGRRPRRETILVEPCHISNASKAGGLILLDCPFPPMQLTCNAHGAPHKPFSALSNLDSFVAPSCGCVRNPKTAQKGYFAAGTELSS